MTSSQILTEYFLSGKYKSEINRNNPLGMKGMIADTWGNLTKQLWAGGGSHVIAPRELKSTIAKFAPQFGGGAQHDFQEFMAFLLDGLHEDLNRVHQKSYKEVGIYNSNYNAWKSNFRENYMKEMRFLNWKYSKIYFPKLVMKIFCILYQLLFDFLSW